MTIDTSKTIYALATPPGKAGVGVIRISGPNSLNALKSLTKKNKFAPKTTYLNNLYNLENDEIIDQALCLYFASPASFTGEDVVELHIHSSRSVINKMFDQLSKLENFRLAEAGEFSKRAFLNDKLDLTQAEGLADLIDAETSLQHKQALRQMNGELSNLYENWRKELIHIMAYVEAFIDFPEEDIPTNIIDEIHSELEIFKSQIKNHLNDSKRGQKLKEGVYGVIIGAPNVGKSSLLNYLAQREVAIVSNIAGTTRDIIEIDLDLEGYPITLADTAGIRESADIIESEGVKRALKRANEADFKIIMFSADDEPDQATLELIDKNSIILINKTDLLNDKSNHAELSLGSKHFKPIYISLTNNSGLDEFLKSITDLVGEQVSLSSTPSITRARYREHLQECLSCLEEFNLNKDIELASEDLRMAARSIGKITGIINVEQILDVVFSSFCIGK